MKENRKQLFIVSVILLVSIFVIGYTKISSDKKPVDRTPKSPLVDQPPPVELKSTKITLEEAIQTITEAECKEYVYKLLRTCVCYTHDYRLLKLGGVFSEPTCPL